MNSGKPPRFTNPRAKHGFAGRTCSIVGVGSYVPPRVLTNADLEKIVDTTDEWITSRTGIKERHIAGPQEYTSDLGAEAARRAMAHAKVTADQIDLIIVASITPDMPFPATACLVQSKIGAHRAAGFDLEAACSGFIYALEVGQQFIMSRTCETVLVIGAEKLSAIIDWTDRNTCVLFGDGAGAVVLQNRPGSHGLLTACMGADGGKAELLLMPGGGSRNPATPETVAARLHYLKMDGKDTYKNAEPVEPHIDLVQWRRVDGVEPAGALGSDRRKAAVAQDLEVLRDGRLRDPELGLDDGGDGPGGQLAVGEQLEDPPPDRVAKDIERMHAVILEACAYISQEWGS